MKLNLILGVFRNIEDDKGALSGAIHSAVMDNAFKRFKLLIEVIHLLILQVLRLVHAAATERLPKKRKFTVM